jgi:hypothetical protein
MLYYVLLVYVMCNLLVASELLKTKVRSLVVKYELDWIHVNQN